jgi:hypothetical protein
MRSRKLTWPEHGVSQPVEPLHVSREPFTFKHTWDHFVPLLYEQEGECGAIHTSAALCRQFPIAPASDRLRSQTARENPQPP